MDGLSLLAEAHASGLRVEVQGDRLVVRGPRQFAPLAKKLIEYKDEVIQALAVASRAVAFRRQLAGWRGCGRPGWPLFVLPDASEPGPGVLACISCSAPIAPSAPAEVTVRARCPVCVEAVRLAIEGEAAG